jgi:hypothetical protein
MMGWLLLVAALVPALSSSILTGVVSTVGLFGVAVAGIAMIAGTGAGTREWILCAGLVAVAVGEWMYWRRCGRPPWTLRHRPPWGKR